MAQPFDEKRLTLAGNPEPVAERVGSFRDGAFFSVSANGVLVFREANIDFQVALFDRQGTLSGRAGEPGGFRGAALSPDGRAPSRRARTLRTRRRPICGCSICRDAAASHDSHLARARPSFPSGLATESASPSRSTTTCSTRSRQAAKGTRRSSCARTARAAPGRRAGRRTADSFSTSGTRPLQPLGPLGPSLDGRKPVPFLQTRFIGRPGPVLTRRTMGGLCVGSLRRGRSLRPGVHQRLQRRLGQHGRLPC